MRYGLPAPISQLNVVRDLVNSVSLDKASHLDRLSRCP